jgi:hypothetical protein
VNIGEVDPKFKGHPSLNYKTPMPDEVLMQLPRRSLAFEVPPEYVLRGRRSRPRLTVIRGAVANLSVHGRLS